MPVIWIQDSSHRHSKNLFVKFAEWKLNDRTEYDRAMISVLKRVWQHCEESPWRAQKNNIRADRWKQDSMSTGIISIELWPSPSCSKNLWVYPQSWRLLDGCRACHLISPIKHRNGDDVLKKENNKKMRIKVCRRGKRKIEALCSSLRADPIGIFQFTAYGTNVFIDRSASGTQQTNNISALSIIHWFKRVPLPYFP